MEKRHFPNPKLNLPKELRDTGDRTVRISFEAVENYLNAVGDYIFTDINLNRERSDPSHIHAWIQRTVSANILRSLYIRNAFVEAVNARNTVGIFLPLKAWFETVGVLAAILDLLESNLSPDELYEKFQPYALGNKGKSAMRVGTVEAKSVAHMMQKADEYMQKMVKETGGVPKAESFFTGFYDVASNPSHPSSDAYEIVGSTSDGGLWSGKNPDEIKETIVEALPYYGGLLMAPLSIRNICEKIFKLESEHFTRLGSRKYFGGEKEIKKEVGGMKLPEGMAIGPLMFSKDGKKVDAIMGPAIIPFDYGITNSLNRLDKASLPIDEFQAAFNSQIEDLISETLIYFQNRLKVIAKGKVGEFNSIDRCIKEYGKYDIDLGELCDTRLLVDLDRVRGRKHHSDRRYDADYTIDGVAYDTVERLRELNRRVHGEIHKVNDALSKTHPDYETKVTQTPNGMSVEFTAKNHAFDLTRGGRVVPPKPKDQK